MHSDYTGQGFDQLLDVIHKIKNNPDDRRIVLSAWNPCDLKLMALPPCHMFAQVCKLVISKFLLVVPVLTESAKTPCSFMLPKESYLVKCINGLLIWVLESHLILHLMRC